MRLIAFLGLCAAAVYASPIDIIHDKPHHIHEVLENLHKTPHCAYECIFEDKFPLKFAPECGHLQNQEKKGKEFGACLCRANAFQYFLDKCIAAKCSPEERKEVQLILISNESLFLGEGIEYQELQALWSG
jgi:hypothetical protein